jgi:signal transduction histidine kinase
MEERVALVGGTITFRQLLPSGSRVAATVPLDANRPRVEPAR